jgi:UDP-N-acetylglucosamine 2-epimerase (non-hydrolysing)
MSQSFFEQLEILIHISTWVQVRNTGCSNGSYNDCYEKALGEWMPDICIVVGDVNSTMACSIVARKAV